jgi:hypothetical protein
LRVGRLREPDGWRITNPGHGGNAALVVPAPLGRIIKPCPTSDPGKMLQYQWSNFPCGHTIAVQWTTVTLESRGERQTADFGQPCSIGTIAHLGYGLQ